VHFVAQGERVGIRHITMGDIPLLAKWWNDGEIMAPMGFRHGMGATEFQLQQRFSAEINDTDPFRISRRYIIVDRQATNKPIGELAYGELDLEHHTCRIAIKIGEKAYQGKGYGYESLSVFIEYLFEHFSLRKIEIDTLADNLPAYYLYKKLGFIETRVEKNYWTDPDGVAHDLIFMEMTSEQRKQK